MKRILFVTAALMAGTAMPAFAAAAPEAIVSNYADIALATYEDSLTTAQALREAIDKLVAEPSEQTLVAARTAWLAARVPYQQSEAFRFGNPIVDDWEGRVNAWPLDEGLIDYVDAGYGTESDTNQFYVANIIANDKVSAGGTEIDAATITPEVLESLHEVGGIEANVATGYHAIEFLLWGQDLNGTDAGAGNRPYTDFDPANCTGGHCDRRIQYLTAAADLLISDLEEMVANWQTDGEARAEVSNDPTAGLTAILTGLGSLSYGELAGERMKLGLLLNDPEEEHDCFSDNTHNSHYYDLVGIRNVYFGAYERVDGSKVEGASLAELVSEKDPALAEEMKAKLDATLAAMTALKERAEGGEAYDQMIGQGNEEGNAVVQAAIDGLVDQTRSLERVITALDLGGIELEGSDSLDNPNAVFE
ncbi:imelysin [Nitratireductor indicus C115]|uniref:Imelysin n=1 Tax=Nitratireductor indicus C115 TaxID=1231190 RepID=K2PKY6_9HYPH|nr:imelysin family protein [Nitratireductor indicus]EKF41797.1 imelysin [Nitratireductor indicus C115]SFQ67241.1 putative iron-regulated protein [Nitratireductor indicus]